METRARNLVFEFNGSTSHKTAPRGLVTANGVVSYADDSFFLQVGTPVTVPVTGGSLGWYAATGQVTSTRLNPDGEHSHTFEVQYSVYKRNPRTKNP